MWEQAAPWPSRRGWLHEDAAWNRLGNDGSANAGGPITIVGCLAFGEPLETEGNKVPAFGRPEMPTSSASRRSPTDSVCHARSCARSDTPDSSAY